MEERKEDMNVTTKNEKTNVVASECENFERSDTNGVGAAIAALGIVATVGYAAGKGIEWGVKQIAPKVKKLFTKKQDETKVVDAEAKEVTDENKSDSEESTK